MSATTWYIISLVGYFAALICLVVTVVLYFKLDILDVIGDLTGRTVAKELKSMRENRNARGASSRARKISKSPSTSKSAKTRQSGTGKTRGKTSGKTAGTPGVQTAGFSAKRSKNGTAQMGSGVQSVVPDKRVLHSKTDKLSRDTEELYEDFDPRVEYSRTDILVEATEEKVKKGTALLRSGTEVLTENELVTGAAEKRKGTEVLKPGTMLLDEKLSGGTALLVEEEQVEPVKFSITRSYLVVHSEEKIL